MNAALPIARQIAGEGLPVPPLGFLADAAAILSDQPIHFIPCTWHPQAQLLKRFDNHVLGRLMVDRGIVRAKTAMRRYNPSERLRAVAFIIRALCERLALTGMPIAAATFNELSLLTEDEREEQMLHAHDNPMPELLSALEKAIHAFRAAPNLLSEADLQSLEHRVALGDWALRIAHRQVIEQSLIFQKTAPARWPRHESRISCTRIAEEDQYPVGGYASIDNRGSPESLLHSQLAFMEPGPGPDLFDARLIRDEMLYYTRDENLLRYPRRRFAFHFAGDLVAARVKDPAAPVQRIVLASAVVLAIIRVFNAQLGQDTLTFTLSFDHPLAEEKALFEAALQHDRNVVFGMPAAEALLISTTSQGCSDELIVAAMPVLRLDQRPVPLETEGWPGAFRALLHGLALR